MRYIKYFESKETPKELLIKYADDIVKVITTYYSTHTGDLCEQIDEIIWNTEAGDEFDETGKLTENMMMIIVEEYKSSASNRDIEKLLNLYYDCRPFVKSINQDLTTSIEEIFFEYSDEGNCRILKTSKFNDDRYEVDIKMKDIFLRFNFQEVVQRMKDLGFDSYSVYGVKNGSSENMKFVFWKPLPKEITDEFDIDTYENPY